MTKQRIILMSDDDLRRNFQIYYTRTSNDNHSKYEHEWYNVFKFIALCNFILQQRFQYPITLIKNEAPDFIMETEGKFHGIEVTRATSPLAMRLKKLMTDKPLQITSHPMRFDDDKENLLRINNEEFLKKFCEEPQPVNTLNMDIEKKVVDAIYQRIIDKSSKVYHDQGTFQHCFLVIPCNVSCIIHQNWICENLQGRDDCRDSAFKQIVAFFYNTKAIVDILRNPRTINYHQLFHQF